VICALVRTDMRIRSVSTAAGVTNPQLFGESLDA
jgi:hypothetical protein